MNSSKKDAFLVLGLSTALLFTAFFAYYWVTRCAVMHGVIDAVKILNKVK